ncbi:hypothetical protein [Catenulispora pinisilvae]|uniref:hypothetical protein n=1 Tax=Catenulispora pinisilvae TaxID=2705253 RepID=UPI0018925D58|nr:hypothetical protein [Catenulispora pinisilvae]
MTTSAELKEITEAVEAYIRADIRKSDRIAAAVLSATYTICGTLFLTAAALVSTIGHSRNAFYFGIPVGVGSVLFVLGFILMPPVFHTTRKTPS